MRLPTFVFLFMTLSLAACSTPPEVKHVTIAPAAHEPSFAVVTPENEVSQEIASLVQSKLESMGYADADSPAFLVQVSEMEHPAVTGAYIAEDETDAPPNWITEPASKRKKSRKKVMIIRVRFLAPDKLTPFEVSTVRYVSSKGTISDHAAKMIDALFETDPLKAPANPSQ